MHSWISSKLPLLKESINKGHSRSVKVKKNILFSFFVKGGSIAVGLLLVPLTIKYINATQYGIWITLSSIIGWFSFFDIGFGNGLRNKFAESVAHKDYKLARIYVSTTYALLAIIIAIIFLVFLSINFFVNWAEILNTSPALKKELSLLALIVFVFFCLQFLLQLIIVVMTANHEPAKASVLNLLGSVLSLFIIFVLTKTTNGNLIYLGWVLGASPVIILLISSIWLYNTSYKAYSPSFKYIQFSYIKELSKTGGVFFIIQIGAIILFQTDNIVITQLFGPKDVTIFNISHKLFFIFIMAFSIIVTPLWSSFTEAYAINDLEWIKITFKKLKKLWLYSIPFVLLLLISSPYTYKIWIGSSVQIPFSLSLFMAFYVLGYNWLMIHCYLLNGIGKLRIQLYLYAFSMLINIPISILLGRIIGVEGVVLSNILIFIIMDIVLSVQCKKILSNTAHGIWNK